MRPASIDLHYNSVSRSGGQTYTGIEQIVSTPAGRWEGKISLPRLRDRSSLLAWRAFVAAMQGRVGTALIPAFEAGRAPWPIDAQGRLRNPAFARPPQLRMSPYAVDPALDPQISILVSGAPAMSTTLHIAAFVSGSVTAGMRFSIGNSLYEIMNAVQQPTTDGSQSVLIDIRPWLRADVADNSPANFMSPVCQMRFLTDNEGKLDLDVGRIASPEINLVEAV